MTNIVFFPFFTSVESDSEKSQEIHTPLHTRASSPEAFSVPEYTTIYAEFSNSLSCTPVENESSTAANDGTTSAVVHSDASHHTHIHLILQAALSTQALAAIEPSLTVIADKLLRSLTRQKSVDFMKVVARPFPVLALATVVGVPTADRAEFLSWEKDISARRQGKKQRSSWHNFHAYVHYMINVLSSMPDPPDHLITRLLYTEIDGRYLTDDEIHAALLHLILAGNNRVTFLIGTLLYKFLDTPEQWLQICQKPELIPGAIEETQAQCHLPATSAPIVPSESAHLCPETAFAHLQARVVLELLARCFPSLRLAPDFHYEEGKSAVRYSSKHLYVTW